MYFGDEKYCSGLRMNLYMYIEESHCSTHQCLGMIVNRNAPLSCDSHFCFDLLLVYALCIVHVEIWAVLEIWVAQSGTFPASCGNPGERYMYMYIHNDVYVLCIV